MRAPVAAKAPEVKVPPPRTESASIAVGNLASQINSMSQVVAANPDDDYRKPLVTLLLLRAEMLGQLADYDRAEQLAEEGAARKPHDAGALILRAGVRARLHRFDEALADLAAGAKAHGDQDAIARARATIYAATGRTAEATTIVAALPAAASAANAEALWTKAGLAGDAGRVDEAVVLYEQAKAALRTDLPFPVAWIEFQEGLLYERAGRTDRARTAYEIAHARLPPYAPVTSHLAATLAAEGDRDAAIALLEPLVAASDDPEYQGQLAALYHAAGRASDADPLLARAKQGYDALVAKHPAAFADHAAHFWLGPGGDPAKALPLAEKNLTVRKTADAYQLAIDAALAAKEDTRACGFASAAETLPPSARLDVTMWRAYKACGRGADAERIDRRVRDAGP